MNDPEKFGIENNKNKSMLMESVGYDRWTVRCRDTETVFFADVYMVEKFGEQLTTFDYHAYLYRPYSEDISTRLEELVEKGCLDTRTQMRAGKTDTMYSVASSVPKFDNLKIVCVVANELKDYNGFNLTELS